MSALRICLFVFVAVMVVSVFGASTAQANDLVQETPNVHRPMSRSKRNIVTNLIGYIFEIKARVLTSIFDIIDVPLRWVVNLLGKLANHFYDPPQPQNPWNGSNFGLRR